MHRLIEEHGGLGGAPASLSADARPRSATPLATGLAGLLGAALAFAALARSGLPIHLTALGIIGGTAGTMIAAELLLARGLDRQTSALMRPAVRPLDIARVARKLAGLAVTIGVIAAAYWLLAEYRQDFYAPFFAVVPLCAPVFLLVAPLYVSYVDRRQGEPEDVYAEIGAFVLSGRMPRDLAAIRQHALGWAVKGFFLPLMFVYLCSIVGDIDKALDTGNLTGLMAWHGLAQNVLFGVDVLFACVGYGLTLRLLDTHIRSVEPSVLGWVACLICYRPINGITSAYITYDAAGYHWDAVLGPWPAVRLMWGAAILLLLVIYVWATVSFGLRFSNLTNRGIITGGPFRWVKHPAYVSKNISWWLISMPFLLSAGIGDAVRHSAMLLLVNGIYLLRAITEERHLSRDPDYVAYKAYIARHGLWARLKQAFEGARHATTAGVTALTRRPLDNQG